MWPQVQKVFPWAQAAYAKKVLAEVELPWQTDTTQFPSAPESDAVATSNEMHAKYG
mgnify:CR=1 FL=1